MPSHTLWPVPVAVVKEMLAVRVVDAEHGEVQLARGRTAAQADHAGGGFLAAAAQVFGPFRVFLVQNVHHVAAVINEHVGLFAQDAAQIVVVFFRGAAVGGVDGHAAFAERSAYVVLGGEGIAARRKDVGAALMQHLGQIGGLGLQMNGDGHLQPFQRAVALQVLRNAIQHRHVAAGPFDLLPPLRREGCVPDDGCHETHLIIRL